MTMLMEFSGPPLVRVLGWTLLHFLWQGTLAALVLWLVLGFLGGRSSQARYRATCVALALMVAMPMITFARIASAKYKTRTEIQQSAIAIDSGMLLMVGIGEPAPPWPAKIAMALDRNVPWILTAWFVGAIFFVVRLNLGMIVARRLKRVGTQAPPLELQHLFNELKLRIGVVRAVSLLHSARVQVPTVIGWLRPVVLIPASCLTGLSTLQIEAILCHELAHVRRHDYLVSVLQSMAEALLFYHPAIWWVSKQVRRERECCCDEIAVGNGGDVLAYAKALSYLEERRAAFPEFVLGANGGVLAMRIKRLLGCRDDAQSSQFAVLTLVALIVAVAGSYLVSVARAQPKSTQPAPTSIAASGSAQPQATGRPQRKTDRGSAESQPLQPEYENWVDEDVIYIITPEERTGYLRQTNNEERDKFIETFWERRNPTTGSTENSTKDEHYARIAYANQHFATKDEPGWKTDRGRAYIVNGKPESVDALPTGGQSANGTGIRPFEVWHYRSAEGGVQSLDLRFVDDCMCGKYLSVSQTPGPGIRAGLAASGTAAAPPVPTRPIRVSAGVMAGNALSVVHPVYPADAKARHVQGVVVLHAIISKTGEIENLQVVSGPPLLTGSAIDAVQRWKYKPYLLNGQPTEVETTINVNYTLGGDSAQGVPPSPDPESTLTAGLPPAMSGEPVRVSGAVMAGTLIAKVMPVYPADAKAAGVQGAVVLRALILKSGEVEDLQVVSGPKQLTESAITAVKQWKYDPYLLNGEPVDVQTTITVNYSLGDSTMPQGQSDVPVPTRRRADGTTTPILISQIEPQYTKSARKAKTSGTVLVNLTVDEQGRPQHVHVLRGVGNGLDKKAVDAVKQYRFKPAMKDDKPVQQALNVEVNFQMF